MGPATRPRRAGCARIEGRLLEALLHDTILLHRTAHLGRRKCSRDAIFDL